MILLILVTDRSLGGDGLQLFSGNIENTADRQGFPELSRGIFCENSTYGIPYFYSMDFLSSSPLFALK